VFTSYAQNFEDVMLWRALKHVQNGVYVDVGAQHPVVDSVSRAFYESGWRGIHIEPVPEYAELLRKDRPDETVLQIALADTEGTLEINVIPDTGLSTAVNAYAQRHQMERGFEHQRIQVPVLTLKSALKLLVGKDVHWLKIDVEGFEEQVLNGWNSQTLRPWIMVIEATIPLSTETDYERWDPILIAANYQFVYFDGLNRFYVAKEHAELAEAFYCPPNVFDDTILDASSHLCRGVIASYQARQEAAAWAQKSDAYASAIREQELDAQVIQGQAEIQRLIQTFATREQELNAQVIQVQHNHANSQTRAQWLENEWNAAKAKIDELNHHGHHWKTMADGLNRELQSVYASKSWRITAPLRKIMLASNHLLALPPRLMRWAHQLARRITKSLAVWAIRRSIATPTLKAHALNVLAKHPHLMQQLRQFAMRSGLVTGSSMTSQINRLAQLGSEPESVAGAYPPNLSEKLIKELSPRVVRIYSGLQKAINERVSNAHCN